MMPRVLLNKKLWGLLFSVAVFGLLVVVFAGLSGRLLKSHDFTPEVSALLAAESAHPPTPGSVIFTGSSSIRLWPNLADAMAPIPAVNRGFGGSRLLDVLIHADRLILADQPPVVVIYAGENDIGPRWAWPGLVLYRFQRLVTYLHARNPDLQIIVLAIKPSPFFEHRWHQQQRANRHLEAFAAKTTNVEFLDVATILLDAEGQIRAELYSDGLHLNAAGYALWQGVVFPALLAMQPAPLTENEIRKNEI